MAGNVLVDEQKIDKAGALVEPGVKIRLLGESSKYVSRGGLKLEGALKAFGFNPEGMAGLDIGASTGGFTDCLLQNGAKKVIALDVGYNQLDWKIRSEPRVTVIEKCNFRYATRETIGGEAIAFATIDVSFISLDKILPPLYNILDPGGYVISLVKPQFEAERDQVEKGGLVKDPAVHEQVMGRIKKLALATGFEYLADMVSPITGTDGNKEYFVFLRKPNA